MADFVRDSVGGGYSSGLAARWAATSWPSKTRSPSSYLIEHAILRDEKNRHCGVENSIVRFMMICAVVFAVCGIFVGAYTTMIGEFPGFVFFLKGATYVAVCLIFSGWLLKLYCYREKKHLDARHHIKMVEWGVGNLKYGIDYERLIDQFEPLILGHMGFEQLPKIMKIRIVTIARDILLSKVIGQDKGAKILKDARTTISCMLSAAQKFGFCLEHTSEGLLNEAQQLASNPRD